MVTDQHVPRHVPTTTLTTCQCGAAPVSRVVSGSDPESAYKPGDILPHRRPDGQPCELAPRKRRPPSSRHKNPPLAFRPGIKSKGGSSPADPDGDREWLMAYAAETGRPYGAILAEMLALYRKQVEDAKALLSGQGTVRRP